MLTDDELNKTFIRFKELADKKKEITTADLEALFSSDQVCLYEEKKRRKKKRCIYTRTHTHTHTFIFSSDQVCLYEKSAI